MLDDFGLNEEQGDTYGDIQKAASRQQETLAVLRAVFGTPVEIFPFVLPGQAVKKGAAGRELIAAAAERIERFLD